MLKKEFFLLIVVLFGAIGSAAEVEPQTSNGIHGDIGVILNTKHVWRGFLTYGADSSVQPFIDLDFMGSGFHFEIVGNKALDSGWEDAERWDYSPYYMGAFGIDKKWETHYKIGWRYFNYPDNSSHSSSSIDLQEFYAGFAFPNLFGVARLVPGYVVIKGWPSNSGTVVGGSNPNGGTYSGWGHVFMLDYGLPIKGLTENTPEQMLNFHLETVYNDGVDPRPGGGYTDSDWTHVMAGVSTDFALGHNFTFTPGLYYQITFEDNGAKGPNVPIGGVYQGVAPDHDIFWASFTLKYTF